jgi:DNA-binding XRE family transcriptional regulator
MKKKQVGDPKRNYASEWKEWRGQRGWTQKQMALTLDMCRRAIVYIEKGKHRPCVSSRIKFNELQKKYQEENRGK